MGGRRDSTLSIRGRKTSKGRPSLRLPLPNDSRCNDAPPFLVLPPEPNICQLGSAAGSGSCTSYNRLTLYKIKWCTAQIYRHPVISCIRRWGKGRRGRRASAFLNPRPGRVGLGVCGLMDCLAVSGAAARACRLAALRRSGLGIGFTTSPATRRRRRSACEPARRRHRPWSWPSARSASRRAASTRASEPRNRA